jgi:8-oxoguanine deaminase
MSTILLENIDTLATFDAERRVLKNAWVLIRDNRIAGLGAGRYEGEAPERRMDLASYVVMPGMVNLHHHFFQSMLRNVPSLHDVALFRWLRDMYMLMSEVRDEDLYTATKIAVAELLLSGCTTATDHSYLKVNDMQFDTEIRAAREMGIRFELARGSLALGQRDGALPPDHLIEQHDDILADTERLITTYHEPQPGGMTRVANAPCSAFSAPPRLWTESIALARKHGVNNHAHIAEAPDEERYMLEVYGRRSVEMAEEWGWVGPDVWYAHATVVNDHEKEIMRRTNTGVSNCPNSNMYTAATVCDVVPMLKMGGIKIGIGVDGNAANNSGNMMHEVRSALLMQRAFFGADAMSPTQALELATLGGAAVLRRDDIGVLAAGKMADLIGYDTRRLAFSGGLHDPLAGLVFCDAGHVDLSIVNGVVRVARGQLLDVDLGTLVRQNNQQAAALVARAEKRFGASFTHPVWRRAYPYDSMFEHADLKPGRA